MNFILNSFHDESIRPITDMFISDYKESKFIVIDNYKKNKDSTQRVQYINFKDATFAQYLIDWAEIEPLDNDLLQKLSACELEVLKMMDRLEPHIGKMSYNKRKNLYLKHVRYWNHVILNNDISYFISGNIPHENYDYIIYSLCKIYNIKTLFFNQSMPDFVILLDRIFPFFPKLNDEYLKLKQEFSDKKTDEIKLGDRAKKIFDLQVLPDVDSTPVYMKKIKFGKRLQNSVKKTAHFFSKIISKLFSKDFYKNIFSPELYPVFLYRTIGKVFIFFQNKYYNFFYEKHCTKVDFSKKFIYQALHLQPELTTNPMGGVFANQLLITQMLDKYLPDDFYIYVKENPKQKKWGRSLDFYRELKKLKKVKLISKKEDTYKLLENCTAVATVTGTAGWEALFRNKPVLLFGEIYYQYAQGVFKIKTNKELEKALEKIINQNFRPDLIDMKIYVKAFETTTLPGYYNEAYVTNNVTKKENMSNLYKALKQEIG